jgi:hypothetical protein
MVPLLLRAYLLRRSRDLVAVWTCLRSRRLVTGVSSGSVIPAFSRLVTMYNLHEAEFGMNMKAQNL